MWDCIECDECKNCKDCHYCIDCTSLSDRKFYFKNKSVECLFHKKEKRRRDCGGGVDWNSKILYIYTNDETYNIKIE